MDRSWRNTGLAIGGLLLVMGLLMIVLALGRRHIGFGEFGMVLIGAVLSIFGIIFTGFGSAVRAFFRRLSTRRLARRLTRILGSPAEPNLETASVRWLGLRDGRRVALTWTLDYPGTQVAMEIDGGSPGTLRILPNLSRGGRLIGGRSLTTGHEEFDRQFLTRSEPTTLIGDLFSGDRRDLVARALLDLPHGASSRVILTLHDVRVRVPRIVLQPELFLRATGILAGAIRDAARTTGYSILSVGAGTSGKCPVCISLLESEVVLCIRCRTPHHQGCWEYTRECAVFACGGRRWVNATTAP